MSQTRVALPRVRDWRVRIADSLTATMVGWVACSKLVEWLRPDYGRLQKELLTLGLAGLFGIAGLFLIDLVIVLDRKTRFSGRIVLLVRFVATASVGAALFSKFVEGCFAAVGVLAFVAFLLLVYRVLEVSRIDPNATDAQPGRGASPKLESGSPAQLAPEPGVLTPGIRGRLDRFFASVLSGILSGSLMGAIRLSVALGGSEKAVLQSGLLPTAFILLTVAVRFLLALLIQGKAQLRGWKAGALPTTTPTTWRRRSWAPRIPTTRCRGSGRTSTT